MEILGVNIQCCSLSTRKMDKSQNVLVSVGKLKHDRKSALIKPMSHNFWNVRVFCIIWFSNQNFQVFRVNGKDPRCIMGNVGKVVNTDA